MDSSAHGPHSTQPAERQYSQSAKSTQTHLHKEHQMNAKHMKTNPVVLGVLKLNQKSDGKTSSKHLQHCKYKNNLKNTGITNRIKAF